MDLGIKGKNALVTGGSRGLGRQSALSLAEEGVSLAICARGGETLQETAEELRAKGVKVAALQTDMTQPDAPEQVFSQAVDELGQVDILVNNVGGSLGARGDLLETDDDKLKEVFDLNLWAATRLMKLATPPMRQRGWGRIVNIASIFGREHGGGVAYMSAKASLIAATKHLALSVGKDGVCVNSVAPGSIIFPGGVWDRFVQNNTPEAVEEFIDRNIPAGKFGPPEPVGDTVAYLASERASWIMGACVNVDGGQSHSLI